MSNGKSKSANKHKKMKTFKIILLAITALLMSGMMKAQTAAPANGSTATKTEGISVNQRGSLHEVSPSGSKMDGKNTQTFRGSAKDIKNGMHHRHQGRHKHHRHHKPGGGKGVHIGLRHH